MRFFNPLPPGSRSPIAVVAGLGLAGIAILVIALILLVENETYRLAVAIIGAVTAAAGLIAWQLMQIHFNRLERLHKAVLVAQSPHATRVVYGNLDGLEGSKDEVAQLHKVIDTLMRDRVADKEKSNQRLEGVLSSIAEAVLVVTNSGLVSLVNAGAKNLLGSDNVAVGTSIYAAVHTSSWEKAVGDIAAQGGVGEIEIKTLGERDLKARMRQLEDKNGVAVVFNAKTAAGAWGIEHDLELHDRPSRPPVIAPELALSDLPCLVLDCETTGLDIANEAIISIGAVQVDGAHIYRNEVIDIIVNPGRPIPKASTAIHGITDDMVASAETFDTVWPGLAALLEERVLVGYNIGFDAAFMQKEAKQAKLNWPDPAILDLMLLYAALEPKAEKLSLDVVASSVGVQIEGRHTALGDALATAEIFTRMLPRLNAVNVTTFKDALEFQKKSRHLIAQQEKANWHIGSTKI